MAATQLDALIVGAGFSGIYQLYRLRQLGLSTRVVDMAGDVGGTWYWNRYPGAMSDTESYLYRFSWDEEDLLTYPWSRHYVKGPQVLEYLRHVVERHDLRKDMQFNTELVSADWNGQSNHWDVRLSTGEVLKVRYLITALGLLSKANYPDIPGASTFTGTLCHTAAWPEDLDLTGKRVGVIGCGSTGVQVITDIASRVKSLTCFQRSPQYSVPSGDRPVEPEYRKWVNENYDQIFDQVRNSIVGFGFTESTVPFKSVTSAEERDAIFEELWNKGNGFRFFFGGFCDLAIDREGNEAACAFIRKKISQIVKDPEKARKLSPHEYYARRPLCDAGYFEQFNRPNVDIVHLRETPIVSIRPQGIETTAGLVELDVIVFATGFDAIDGSYNRIRIRGRDGLTLKEKWEPRGPTSYLGVAVPSFPNLFLITGPQGPFTNLPPAIEAHVDLTTRLITHAEEVRKAQGDDSVGLIEALPEAEQEWCQRCENMAAGTLFHESASWIFGRNIPGKKIALRFYFGGLKSFYEAVNHVIEADYEGFRPINQSSPAKILSHDSPSEGIAPAVGMLDGVQSSTR
ncbi:hypothetical protein PV10_06356 [Exophiala mesophila]|uniref:FAD/NAD(P)-binding domain-containing protein n=1 Tax=Exophiala mesophila TaxID=212818 RepID=A0A0D1WRS8_EXOME|nr:uncharacterized protein PV10_06356 [Exophiala mesophila]KIV91865.1 hypothetical protein PV10_06356 [Exophiala mesophila]